MLEQLLTTEYAGVRSFYLEGVTELMSISAEHELIKSILDALLVMFFANARLMRCRWGVQWCRRRIDQ